MSPKERARNSHASAQFGQSLNCASSRDARIGRRSAKAAQIAYNLSDAKNGLV